MNHVTVGVYANGSMVYNIVPPENLEAHIDYNKVMRFGRGLFVDGKCVNHGYLSESKIREWEEKISKMKFNTSVPSDVYR